MCFGWCVIYHAPPAVSKVQLSILVQFLGQCLNVSVLLAPPSLKEGLLDVQELAIRVGLQSRHHTVQNVLHSSMLLVQHQPKCV